MNNKRTSRHRLRSPGMALPIVLVCIALIMAFGAVLLQTVLLQHRQLQLVEQQHQSLWLAESGLQRAAYQLRTSPEYRGEVWQVPATTLGGPDAGVVSIVVEPEAGDAGAGNTGGWKVIVEAYYPDDPTHRVLQYRERVVLEPAASEG